MGTSFKAGRRVPRRRRGGRRPSPKAVVANPYVRALMRDRALRSELEDAYGSLAKAYGRTSRKSRGTDLLEDRKARRELGRATVSLRAASERLSAAKKGRGRGRIILLVAVAGGVSALALSENLRARLLGLASGGGGSPSAGSNGAGPTATTESAATAA
jgi:hypothetical protein